MTDDTRERFLREITAQVPADRIAELHLFRPLRRGGTETGVAVIAVEQEDPARDQSTEQGTDAENDGPHLAAGTDTPNAVGETDLPAAATGDRAAATADRVEARAGLAAASDAPENAASASDGDSMVDDDNPYADDVDSQSANADVELAAAPVVHADAAEPSVDESPADPDVVSARAGVKRDLADVAAVNAKTAGDDLATVDDADPSARDADADAATSDADAAAPRTDAPVTCAVAPIEAGDVSFARTRANRLVRHTVFTARYRLTRKGADRGKWEFEVVADADAPLGTVDMVVRGVQRRAGDDEEPERLTAEGVRAALDGQAWQRTT